MSNEPNLNPVVTIQEGKVKGFLCDDYRGSPFYNFLGIPYAQPPINELRFKAPVPIKPWSGILDCTQGSNISIQEDYISKEIDGSEDCLNLNVFTRQLPAIHTSKKLLKPVMVYIHGGAFLLGSNRKEIYGPEILISEDVVVVTINYRLGLLGFLKFDDPNLNVPGNTALKDMVLALKWVQRNIEHFLGNPKNVTIFGNSAGAAAVHFLVLSPMAKGLFHKAICQSGSALSSWAYADKNTNEQLAKIIGLSKPSEERLYEHLKSLPVEEIYRMQCQLDKIYIKGNRYRFVGAVVEPTKWNGEKFFSDHPLKLLKSGKYNKVPLMMGYNTGDGMILDGMVQPSQNHIYWTDKELNVPGLLNLEKGSSLSKQLGNEIVQFYFGTDEISREKHLKELYDLTTDNSFLSGILRSIRHHRTTSNVPIYMYQLSIDSELCFYKRMLNIQLPGVCHADEIGYLFSTVLTSIPSPRSIEDVTQRRMCRLWTNFAKYSDPTPYLDPLLEIIWQRVKDPNNISFLDIFDNLSINQNPNSETMKFWDKIYSMGQSTSKL